MSKQIELQSDKTFNVYKELSFLDRSIDVEKAKVISGTDLLRVQPTFTSTNIKIRKGVHKYKDDILAWPTIRSFIKQGAIRTIGFSLESWDAEQAEAAEEAKKASKKEAKKEPKKAVKEEDVEEKVEETPVEKKKQTTRKPRVTKAGSGEDLSSMVDE